MAENATLYRAVVPDRSCRLGVMERIGGSDDPERDLEQA